MMPARLYVQGMGWLAPFSTLDDVAIDRRCEPEKPDLSLLTRSLRRGLSDVTRYFAHAAKVALDDADMAPQDIPTIFASSLGEIAVAEALLAHAYDEDGSSPARFRNSVHNTAPGLFSISAGNTKPSTAIAAGFATTAMALLEASMQLAREYERVLLVFAEEAVPHVLSAAHRYGPLAVALVLTREPSPRARARLLDLKTSSDRTVEDPFGRDRHPLWPALSLARAIMRPQPSTVWLSAEEPSYTIDVEPLERR